MITIGPRLVKDLLKNSRIIRDGELNKIWLLQIENQFIIVSENNETKEQNWSNLIEISELENSDFLVEMPVEEITSEFLIDLVGDNLSVLTLGGDCEGDYWVARLYSEKPITDDNYGRKELVSYGSICYGMGEDEPCYKSSNDLPHTLASLNNLKSIDLASIKQIRSYEEIFK